MYTEKKNKIVLFVLAWRFEKLTTLVLFRIQRIRLVSIDYSDIVDFSEQIFNFSDKLI